MKKSIIVVLTAIIVLLFSGIAICSAISGTPPPPPINGYTPTPYPTTTPYQTTAPYQTTTPSSGLTPITHNEVIAIGGEPPEQGGSSQWEETDSGEWEYKLVISSIQIWIVDPATGQWTFNPINMNRNADTWLLIHNDQHQTISTEETTSGGIDKKDWGWFSQGDYYYRFIADTPGQHRIVAVGGNTGRSNELTINVAGPTTPFTVSAAWPSSYTYYIGSPTCIYFTVNKPCYARVTYIKQNSNIVWSGPSYVSAGTHTDTGTIGWPKGKRTVVVDAWTSSGEYDSAVTSYNVV